MYKLIFALWLLSGKVKPMDKNDGRTIYTIKSKGIEHAYKSEVIQFIKTKHFEYNEDLK